MSRRFIRPGLVLRALPGDGAQLITSRRTMAFASLPMGALARATTTGAKPDVVKFVEGALRGPDVWTPESAAVEWLPLKRISDRLGRRVRAGRLTVRLGPGPPAAAPGFQVLLGTRCFAVATADECPDCARLFWALRDPMLFHALRNAGHRPGSPLFAWPSNAEAKVRAAVAGLRSSAGTRAGRWMWGSWTAPRVHLRRIRPQPGCPRCGAAALGLKARPRPPSSDGALRALRSIDVGYAERVGGEGGFGNVPAVRYRWGFASPRGGPGRPLRWTESQHFSGGVDLAARRLGARGEAIERISCLLRRPDAPRTASARLRRASLPPESWALYSEAQYRLAGFPFRRVTPDLPLDWLEARNLASGEALLAPAQLFFTSTRRPRARILQLTTNGAASHPHESQALVAALLEAIERDALVQCWHGRLRPVRLDVAGMDPEVTEAASWLRGQGWVLRLALAPGCGAHVVVAAAQSVVPRFDLMPGGALFSAGASGSARRAAAHAVRELLGFMDALPFVMGAGTVPDPGAMRRTRDTGDVWRFYLRPQTRPLIEWFLRGGEGAVPADLHQDQLGSVVQSLTARGKVPLAVDMSVPAFAPFRAYQVYVCGLLPPTVGTDFVRLGEDWTAPDAQRAVAWPAPEFSLERRAFNPYHLPLA